MPRSALSDQEADQLIEEAQHERRGKDDGRDGDYGRKEILLLDEIFRHVFKGESNRKIDGVFRDDATPKLCCRA